MNSSRRLLKSFMKKYNIPDPLQDILTGFIDDYLAIVREREGDLEKALVILSTFVALVEDEIGDPFIFQPYHQRIDSPFDYYHFGMDLLRPLVRFEDSYVQGLPIVDEITGLLK